MKSPLTLTEAQDFVEQYAPRAYYRETYREQECGYLPWVCAQLEQMTPGFAVDVGPGWGTMSVWLRSHGWGVAAVDMMPLGTFITQELLDATGICYLHCAIETDAELPLLAAEAILMTQVFGHLRYRPDHAVRRVGQWLLPWGTFLCTNIDRARHAAYAKEYADWRDMPLPGDGQQVSEQMNTCEFDAEEYREMLSRCFSNVAAGAMPGGPFLWARCKGAL